MENNREKEKIRLSVLNKLTETAEHFHQDIELLYVMEGKLEIVVGEQEVHMKPEDILVINANKKHSLKGSEDVLYLRLMIDYNMISYMFNSMNVIFWCNSTTDPSERYEEMRVVLKKLLNQYLTTGGSNANFRHISLCYRVVDLLCSYFLVQTADRELQDDQDRFDDRIQQINNYIRANYNQPISLKELSEKLYLSNGYLSRFFKKNYGMNFAEYLTNIRLFHAVDELLYTNTPITMIAYDNGFASVAVFNKAFKKMYGETPSALRKKSKEVKREEEPEQNSKEVDERLEKYLLMNRGESQQDKVIEKQENVHSVSKCEPLKRFWGESLNMGMAEDLLRSSVQEHIILLKETIGFQYVRFCNPFTAGMLIMSENEEEDYNFTRLDGIIDFLMQQGLKPHIEMGLKPRIITYTVQKMMVDGSRNVEFWDPEEWQQIVDAMMKHLTRRYGRSEVNTWRLELWFNENKWDEKGSFENYFELFDILSRTAKKYSNQIQVGGCGVRTDYQEQMRIHFYGNWMKRDVKPDFLSVIVYPYDRGEEKQDHYSKRCTDNECVLHRVQEEEKLLRETGVRDFPLYISEWNLTASARNAINDSAFKAAYVVKNVLDLYEERVDNLIYWSGSDRTSEYFDSKELLYGGVGLISKDGILKPAGFAYEFLKRLYPFYIGKGENYLISTDGSDSYGIICHNQRSLGYNYYFTKEDEIDRNHIWKYFEDSDEMELNLELTDVEDGHYQVKFHRINMNSGSVQNMWKEMDFEPELSRDDIKYFRRVCEPKLTIQKASASGGHLKLNIHMKQNEIVFVRVRFLG